MQRELASSVDACAVWEAASDAFVFTWVRVLVWPMWRKATACSLQNVRSIDPLYTLWPCLTPTLIRSPAWSPFLLDNARGLLVRTGSTLLRMMPFSTRDVLLVFYSFGALGQLEIGLQDRGLCAQLGLCGPCMLCASFFCGSL